LPVPFNEIGRLPERLADWMNQSRSASDLSALTNKAKQAYLTSGSARYCLVLVAQDLDGLRRELQICEKSHRAAWDASREWRTPAGSCLAALPLGPEGKLAFVYPGIGSLYPGFGQTVLDDFPETNEHLQHRIGRDLKGTRSGSIGTNATVETMFTDAGMLAEYGVLMAYIYTYVLRSRFNLHPSLAFGYSLGEISMFTSLGTWQRPELLLDRMQHWSAFNDAVDYKNPPSGTTESEWQTRVINWPVNQVLSACDQDDSVHVTHISTSTESVVVGPMIQLDRICQKLAAPYTELPYAYVFHTKMLEPHTDDIRRVYSLEVDRRPTIDFVSQAPYKKVPHHSASIAQCLINMFCRPVNFPEIVDTAFNADARVFLTVGPRTACSTWMSAILGERPHVAIAVDSPSLRMSDGMTQAMARLLTHRVALDVSATS